MIVLTLQHKTLTNMYYIYLASLHVVRLYIYPTSIYVVKIDRDRLQSLITHHVSAISNYNIISNEIGQQLMDEHYPTFELEHL